MARRNARLCAALLLGLAGRAAAGGGCPAGSGLCRELQGEAPTSIGLVQFHADKNQASHLAMNEQHAAGRTQQLPRALTDLIPVEFRSYLDSVAAQGMLLSLNSLFTPIESQANTLLEQCSEYNADLLGNISTIIGENPEDGLGILQAMVDARLVPISGTWTSIVDLMRPMGPQVVQGLKGLNLTVAADKVEQAHVNLMSAAQWISELLANSTVSIGNFSNATKEERESALQEFDRVFDDGTVTMLDLKELWAEMMTQVFTSLTTVVGDNTTIPLIQGKAKDAGVVVAKSLDKALTGTRQAADLAVRGVQWSATAARGRWLGLALAAACVGASPA